MWWRENCVMSRPWPGHSSLFSFPFLGRIVCASTAHEWMTFHVPRCLYTTLIRYSPRELQLLLSLKKLIRIGILSFCWGRRWIPTLTDCLPADWQFISCASAQLPTVAISWFVLVIHLASIIYSEFVLRNNFMLIFQTLSHERKIF